MTSALSRLDHVAIVPFPWRDPVAVASAFADEPGVAVLHSGAAGWTYLLRTPDAEADSGAPADLMSGGKVTPQGPPFQGGVLALAAYELSAALEHRAPQARGDWPDLVMLRYPALLAFHAEDRRALAVGRGPDTTGAEARADTALSWLEAEPVQRRSGPLAGSIRLATCDAEHGRRVASTVARIAAGEIFQANLARAWNGQLSCGTTPYDIFHRLVASSPAPYAAYLRLPGRALVSNSPERFLSVRPGMGGLQVETAPIKGTRPRGRDPASDAALADELLASPKDRAENLMIVDLMRNDLARTCIPGSVRVPTLAALESFANVHHLVSRVIGRLSGDRTAWDAFLAAFPPGSVTGAPKIQAMQVIAGHEPPRGPYCGSLAWVGPDGALEASVLIRTIALTETDAGWAFEARAGGGVVADSDPAEETAETTAKIGAILKALTDSGLPETA
ncbi:MAG: anthranilate synthase component I family protein [Phenylobacterium sp.]|jgi:para-aminobenzoate synthetase component 1